MHHGVGVLAGVGLGATAGAGCNGHSMFSAAHVAANWDVQGWVGIEEAEGLQEEAHMLCWHDWPVLHPGDVRHPEGVPQDTVSIYQVTILREQSMPCDVFLTPGDCC